MKVLYFHQYFKTPSQAGSIRSYEFARKLIERGHTVTMVCGDTYKFDFLLQKETGWRRGVVDGIDVIQIEATITNSQGVYARAKNFIRFAMECNKVVKKENFDIVFSTSTPLTAGIPGIYAAWKKHAKFVFEVRDLWPELPKAMGMKNPVLLKGMDILEKKSYHSAAGCIGLSPGIVEGIKRRSQPGKPIAMIPNGCDLDIFKPELREPIKVEGIYEGDKVAIFSGTHGLANGVDAILDAAAELLKRGRNDIKIILIGDGKLKPRLKERATRENLTNCIFLDLVPKRTLAKLVASCDMGLMVLANVPAFYYGTSPNKFFDYIASGLPVVNNYPGWLADMINEHHCGIAIEPENATLFADAIEKLADNPEMRKECGENARKLAESQFDRDNLSNQFVDFLELIYKG